MVADISVKAMSMIEKADLKFEYLNLFLPGTAYQSIWHLDGRYLFLKPQEEQTNLTKAPFMVDRDDQPILTAASLGCLPSRHHFHLSLAPVCIVTLHKWSSLQVAALEFQ